MCSGSRQAPEGRDWVAHPEKHRKKCSIHKAAGIQRPGSKSALTARRWVPVSGYCTNK